MQAVKLVRHGWSIRKVGRYLGFHHTAIMRWLRKAPDDYRRVIPTLSSRPHSHPRQLKSKITGIIVTQRLKHNRCAEVVYRELKNQGIKVSLSSVKRTLKREGLIKERSPWKRWHFTTPRPLAEKAGDLIQIDTIHIMLNEKQRFYVYTLIDVYSRWAYAKMSLRINTYQSLKFLKEVQHKVDFKFQTIQTDHGSEFSSWFSEHAEKLNLVHRHSRVRKPNDNGHLERFNRTIQEECLNKIPALPVLYQKAIKDYLNYYNNERLHLGINLLTPLQMVLRY